MSMVLFIFGVLFIGLGLLPLIATIYRLVDEKRGNKTYAFPIEIKRVLLESVVSIIFGILFIANSFVIR